MGADGGKDIVTVSSGGEWAVSASEPWVNISPANGFGATECTVSIDSTLINGMRKAEIRFIPQGQAPCVMTVHQTGYGKMIYIEKPDVEIKASDTYDNRHFDVIVTTNVAFKMNTEYDVIPEKEWLTLPEDPTMTFPTSLLSVSTNRLSRSMRSFSSLMFTTSFISELIFYRISPGAPQPRAYRVHYLRSNNERYTKLV